MNKVEEIFKIIINEARTKEITYKEKLYNEEYECIFRLGFNVVFNNSIRNDLYNFYFHDYNNLIKLLKEYVYTVCRFYNIPINDNEIKKILILLWSNITKEEMLNIENYVKKYIDFLNDDKLININNSKDITDLGLVKYEIEKQSIKQETPYCFISYFEKNNQRYYLPRISFGISEDKCYIYAIQNKNKNLENSYSDLVHKKLNTLNSGVKKYRNVSPSAIASLSLFLSVLKEHNIDNFEVVSNLPLRILNHELVDAYKLQIEKKTKTILEVEKLKKIMEDKRFKIYDNTTEKFKNNFRRLSNHFKIVINKKNELSDNLIGQILELNSNNLLFSELTKGRGKYGKSLRS